MFWPTLECSIIAAGLWITRSFIPDALSPYADIASLAIIIVMFVWLAKNARKRGEERGARYGARRATNRVQSRQLIHDHTQSSDPAYAESEKVRR